MQFEYEKNETDSGISDHRDYRLTNGTDVLDGFRSALNAMTGEVYTWCVGHQPFDTLEGVCPKKSGIRLLICILALLARTQGQLPSHPNKYPKRRYTDANLHFHRCRWIRRHIDTETYHFNIFIHNYSSYQYWIPEFIR